MPEEDKSRAGPATQFVGLKAKWWHRDPSLKIAQDLKTARAEHETKYWAPLSVGPYLQLRKVILFIVIVFTKAFQSHGHQDPN